MNQISKNSFRVMTVLTFAIGLFALYGSIRGVTGDMLYREIVQTGVITKKMIWASQAQDIVSILIAVITIITAVLNFFGQSFLKTVALLGCVWYFFYAFGLYVIQGAYTSIYPLYLIIFGLSVYTMIVGLVQLRFGTVSVNEPSKKLSIGLSIFFILIVAVLVPVWIGKMMNDVALRHSGETYGVFIMDLCIVFPAMLITVYLLLKKHVFGFVLAGVCLIKTITLCLSWAFGEWSQPIAGGSITLEMAAISTTLCAVGLMLYIVYAAASVRKTNTTVQTAQVNYKQ